MASAVRVFRDLRDGSQRRRCKGIREEKDLREVKEERERAMTKTMQRLGLVPMAVMLVAAGGLLAPTTALAGPARTWYVSLEGSDTSCSIGGTSGSPFLTVAMAISCANARDTVSIAGRSSSGAYEYLQTSTLVIDKKLILVGTLGTESDPPKISGGGLV
jgi:hypothetical protein